MESVILSSPFTIFIYGVALFLNLFDRRHRKTKGFLTIVSCVLSIIATVYAICIGTTLWECAAALLIFLLLNMEVGA